MTSSSSYSLVCNADKSQNKYVISIRLTPEMMEELKANPDSAFITLGAQDKNELCINGNKYLMTYRTENPNCVDCFERREGTNTLQQVGSVYKTMLVQREISSTYSSYLRETVNKAEIEKKDRRAMEVGDSPLMRGKRTRPAGMKKVRRPTEIIGSDITPGPTPISSGAAAATTHKRNRLDAGEANNSTYSNSDSSDEQPKKQRTGDEASSEEGARANDNLRQQLIHMLAVEELPLSKIIEKVSGDQKTIRAIIKEIANYKKQSYELKPAYYDQVQFKTWNYTDEERDKVRRRAVIGYEKLPQRSQKLREQIYGFTKAEIQSILQPPQPQAPQRPAQQQQAIQTPAKVVDKKPVAADVSNNNNNNNNSAAVTETKTPSPPQQRRHDFSPYNKILDMPLQSLLTGLEKVEFSLDEKPVIIGDIDSDAKFNEVRRQFDSKYKLYTTINDRLSENDRQIRELQDHYVSLMEMLNSESTTKYDKREVERIMDRLKAKTKNLFRTRNKEVALLTKKYEVLHVELSLMKDKCCSFSQRAAAATR